ncbi:MAG: hypothetical protein K2X87_31505 [Gemmataceae bacterium]|nr:hypothetical protein [Gemmataceae bacterium]
MEPQAEPDYDAVELFWVQGVVRGGQVVLDPPLALPDGTVVTVTKYDPDDNPLTAKAGPVSLDEALRIMTEFTGRPGLADDYLRRQRLREAG